MTITRIQVTNFGVFGGAEQLVLHNHRATKPVVLVGGENGRGKTTLLEAVFLCLYGKLSPFARGDRRSYSSYLASRVHDRQGATTAAIAIDLSLYLDGEPAALRVRRTWTANSSKPGERFSVLRLGGPGELMQDQWIPDDWLSENWDLYWPRVFPVEIAELFFFDGERISELADPTRAAKVVRDSLYALCGIAPVAQLQRDLQIVQKRALKDNDLPGEESKLPEARAALDQAIGACEAVELNRDTVARELATLEQKLESIRNQIQVLGGTDTLRHRDELHQESAALLDYLRGIDEQLRVLAGSQLPLRVVDEIARRAAVSAAAAEERTQTAMEEKQVREHRDALMQRLANARSPEALAVREEVALYFQEALAQTKRPGGDAGFWPKLLSGAQRNISSSLSAADAQAKSAAALLEERKETVDKQSQVTSRLLALPAEDSVAGYLNQEDELLGRKASLEEQYSALGQDLAAEHRRREDAERRYTRVLEEENQNQEARNDAARIAWHAERSSQLFAELESRLVRKHASRLEIELTEKLSMLHSKRLVEHVRINPHSFALELHEPSGGVIDPGRLSAGERQLLAVAALWAIQSYSQQKLPLLIDTPLGRLDQTHRANMVTRFLTEASHQCIVFSTDSEITAELAQEIRDSVGAEYRLIYDTATQSTAIQEGYFDSIRDTEQRLA